MASFLLSTLMYLFAPFCLIWFFPKKRSNDYCCIILGYLGQVLLRVGVWSTEVRGCTCIVLENPQWTLLKLKKKHQNQLLYSSSWLIMNDLLWSDLFFYLGSINKPTSRRRMKTSNIHFILWTWEYSNKLHIRNSVYLIHTYKIMLYPQFKIYQHKDVA